MTITLDKSLIYSNVEMNASIIARSTVDANGDSLFDKIRIQERDKDLLDTFWENAYGNILNELNEFIESTTDTSITLVSNRRFQEAAISDMGDVIANYITNLMTGEWLKLKATEFASIYMDNAASGLKSIFEKLRYKTEPVLKKFGS